MVSSKSGLLWRDDGVPGQPPENERHGSRNLASPRSDPFGRAVITPLGA